MDSSGDDNKKHLHLQLHEIQKRKFKNQEPAACSREKKEGSMNELEVKVSLLEQENEKLKIKSLNLKRENEKLKKELKKEKVTESDTMGTACFKPAMLHCIISPTVRMFSGLISMVKRKGAENLQTTTCSYKETKPHSIIEKDSSKFVPAGIENMGNTCFLNAVLQSFTHTVPLLIGIQDCPHISKTCNVTDFCTICAFREHIKMALDGTGDTIFPVKFSTNLEFFSSHFELGVEGDAQEFVIFFLEKLTKCLLDNDNNLVDDIFGGLLLNKLQCCICGDISNNAEEFTSLSLNILNSQSLKDALEYFTAVEDMDDMMTCDTCDKKVKKKKFTLFHQTPGIAIFHLKRLKKVGNTYQKIGTTVSFPTQLDMSPYTSDIVESLMYDLYAVIEHRGSAVDYGHYVCYSRSAEDKWCLFNDDMVSTVSEAEVRKVEAYILFYARTGTPRFSTILEMMKRKVTEDASP